MFKGKTGFYDLKKLVMAPETKQTCYIEINTISNHQLWVPPVEKSSVYTSRWAPLFQQEQMNYIHTTPGGKAEFTYTWKETVDK